MMASRRFMQFVRFYIESALSGCLFQRQVLDQMLESMVVVAWDDMIRAGGDDAE